MTANRPPGASASIIWASPVRKAFSSSFTAMRIAWNTVRTSSGSPWTNGNASHTA